MDNAVNVLIADDELLAKEGISKIILSQQDRFKLAGCVSNGIEALDFIRENPVNLLITDIRMPIMTGVELIEKLEQLGADIIVIIVSAYSDREYLKHAIRSPIVFDYVNKPFSALEFGELLNSAAAYWKKRVHQHSEHDHLTSSELADEIVKYIFKNDGAGALTCFRKSWNNIALGSTAKCAQTACEILVKIGWSTQPKNHSLNAFSYIYKNIRLLEQSSTSQEMGRCIENFIQESQSFDINREKKITALVSSCIDLINKSISDKHFGVKEAASLLEVTPNYLSSRFSRDMGISFTKYITMLRIEYAKEKLADVRLKIYQISDMVGFDDWRYFNKVFKSQEGMTPSEYRENILIR